MSFCPQCGKPTTPGASFCVACGTTLAPAPPASATPSDPSNPMAAAPTPVLATPRDRPVGVTIIGVVFIVGSAFLALGMLIAMLFVAGGTAWWIAFSREWMPYMGDFGPMMGAIMITMLLLGAAIAGLGIATGMGVLGGREWAWGLTLVIMGLNGLGGLIEFAAFDLSGVVTIAVSALVIWYFFQPDVKRWFGRAT